jgi:predicted ATPase/class 3 adenylate cyclase
MTNLPTGTVTFLFTDIEGSTQLWEKYPEAMQGVLAAHDSILRAAIESNHGHIIKTTGDGVHAVFTIVVEGVNAAIAAQREFQTSESLKASEVLLRVRMGIHTGEAELRAGDYYGQALNRAARMTSAGHGGQILISEVSTQMAREHLPAGVSFLDLGEHQFKGLLRAEKIFQINVPDLQKDFPALISIKAAKNNLPVQLTSFIGRERELTEAKQKLEGARLLTLIGPGGTGKTRLSLQLAADMVPNFSDGVWLVELAPLADPSLILQSIASILGVREQRGMPLLDIVLNFLRAKNLLLIFDNCEHLVEASAQLADQFLHIGPNIKIIASSREALGINGETVYRVPSLSLPGTAKVTPEALEGFESIQLFVERAQAANPNFNLTENNASSIAQICRRLDGIPLALELAAARVKVFSAEQIATRLDDRFRLLTGGSRTALPRQQTLRALIDWSHDMLSEEERALLRRLSVFADGWTFEAAEAMCPDIDAMELLTQLINKSLVIVEDQGEEPRYRLLETVRQYARDKLLEAGEAEQMRDRHLAHFHDLAVKAEPRLYGSEALKWVNRLEAEHDNLRTAMEWGLENHLISTLEMCVALPPFWFRRGMEAESMVLVEEALSRIHTLPRAEGNAKRQQTTLIANAWLAMGLLAFSRGDNKQAVAANEIAANLARQLGDKSLLAKALGFEASGRMVTGEVEGLDASIREGVAAASESGDYFAQGMMLGMFASRMMMSGYNLEAAKVYSDEALALLKKSDNRWGLTMILMSLGMAARYQGRMEEARSNLSVCLPIFHEIGDQHRANMIVSELAHIDRIEGRYDLAAQAYRATITEWERLGHRAAVANQLECFAFIAKRYEEAERAAKLFGAAEALREIINIAMTKVERIEYDQEVADLRTGMDDQAFVSLWMEGRGLSMEAAIELALEKLNSHL